MTEDEKREYRKAYYLKNKERLLQKSKEYKEKHKEELKIKNREYAKIHKEQYKQWSINNRNRRLKVYKDYNKRHSEDSNKNKVSAILYKGGKCSICGISYNGENASIFDYHHLDPSIKDANVSTMLKGKSLTDKMKNEIDKCVLVCANCHRLIHNKKY